MCIIRCRDHYSDIFLLNIPSPLDIKFFTVFICSLHVRCSSILIPKLFYGFSSSNYFDCRYLCLNSVLKWQFLLFDLNIIKWVLPIFSDNLLIFNHSTNLHNSLFIVTLILFRMFPSIKILVSSADNNGKILSDTLTISLT